MLYIKLSKPRCSDYGEMSKSKYNMVLVLLYSYLHNYDVDKCIIINSIEQSLIILYG